MQLSKLLNILFILFYLLNESIKYSGFGGPIKKRLVDPVI